MKLTLPEDQFRWSRVTKDGKQSLAFPLRTRPPDDRWDPTEVAGYIDRLPYTHGLTAVVPRRWEIDPAGVMVITGPTDPAATCGLVAAAVDGWQPSQVVDAMWNRYRVAVRAVASPPGIRFSTAPFNTEGEVDKALDALRTIASEAAPPVTEGAAAH